MTSTMPPIEFLACAYLGDRFARENASGETFDAIAKKAGTSKQQILKLKEGRTVGMRAFYQIATALFHGSIDAISAEAIRWWGTLPEEQRRAVMQWADTQDAKRPTISAKSSRPSPPVGNLPLAKAAATEARSRLTHGRRDEGAGSGERRGPKSRRRHD